VSVCHCLFTQAHYLPDVPWARHICYNSNNEVLVAEVNHLLAEMRVPCPRLQAGSLPYKNTSPAKIIGRAPADMTAEVCRIVRSEVYPEDAALFDKHCADPGRQAAGQGRGQEAGATPTRARALSLSPGPLDPL
jgi:hypothetical protein